MDTPTPTDFTWEIAPQTACDGFYAYEPIGWDTPLPDGRGTPREVVASRSGRLVSLAPWPGWEAPWWREALDWQIWIAPHPRRPAVHVTSSEPVSCPPFHTFPVVGAAVSGTSFRILDNGGRYPSDWGVVTQSTDLPWLWPMSAVRMTEDGSLETQLQLEPVDDLLLSTWPAGLADEMATFDPDRDGLDVPVVYFSDFGQASGLSIVHRRRYPSGAVYSGNAKGGFLQSNHTSTTIHERCPQPEPVAEVADQLAVEAWAASAPVLNLEVDWLVEPPVEASSMTVTFDHVGSATRVARRVDGNCEEVVLAALDGTLSMGGWTLKIDSLALEVREGQIVDIRTHADWYIDGDGSYEWHEEFAPALGRPPGIQSFVRMTVEDDHAVFWLAPGLGFPSAVVAEGSAVWQ